MQSDFAQKWDADTVDSDAIRLHLDRILASPDFVSSEMMSAFLAFVVNETLGGRADRIKQYTIATNVFKRDGRFDQQTDPVVRVQAAKVRRAMQRYYYEEGRSDPIRIDIPKGTYVPTFAHSKRTDIQRRGQTLDVRSRPTVGVMPFENRSGDPTQDYLSSGFAEDLSTELSRFAKVSVVAYYSTQQYQQHPHSICDLGRELDADYLITGSVRQATPQLRVNAQVHCTRTGNQIWAERFGRLRDVTNLFEIQDEILQNVVARVAGTNGAIQQAAAKSTRRKERASLNGYEAVLRALHYDKTQIPGDFRDAIAALEIAVQADPSFTPALAWLATLHLDSEVFGFDSIKDAKQRGIEYAERAVASDPNSQDAHFAMAWACLQRQDPRGATSSAWKMVELNPGDAYFVGSGGWFLALAGDRAKGMEIIERSRALNPNYPTWFHLIACLDLFDRGDFDAAIQEASSIGNSGLFWVPLLKAAALGQLSRIDEANMMLSRLLELNPAFASRPEYYVGCIVLPDGLRSRILAGLEAAGLSKTATTG